MGYGIGVDHSFIGIKIKYGFTPQLGAYTSLGLSQILGIAPALGLQYNFTSDTPKKITPYILGQIAGIRAELTNSSLIDPFISPSPIEFVSRTRHTSTVSFGGGIEYKRKESARFTINLGITYRSVLNKSKYAEFVNEFNNEYQTSFPTSRSNDILPILGLKIGLDQIINKWTKEKGEDI